MNTSGSGISVVIATHNRAVELARTLDTFCRVSSREMGEILIIDNNSSDNTREICQQFTGRLPLAYLFEPTQGKSHALNQAIAVAKGDLLIFTDDDVSVTPEWIAALRDAAAAHPEHDFFGGKVISDWQSITPPRWFRENHEWLGVTPKLDFGPEFLEINQTNRRFFLGANLAVRRRVFDEGLRFDPDFGPRGSFRTKGGRHGSEDGWLQFDMLAQGRKGLYVPDAAVRHRDPPERMTKRYLRWFYTHQGREEVLSGSLPDPPKRFLGAPLYLWRQLAESATGYLITRLVCPSTKWLRHEVAVVVAWAEIQAFRKLRRGTAENARRSKAIS